jgi:hypothetical protein
MACGLILGQNYEGIDGRVNAFQSRNDHKSQLKSRRSFIAHMDHVVWMAS